jgi:hypothetical protein
LTSFLKSALLLSSFILCHFNSFAQDSNAKEKKGIKYLIEKQLSKPDGIRIYPLPVGSYSEETSFLFGASVLAYFKADYKDSLQRPSSIISQAVYTLNKQAVFNIYADGWTKGNGSHYIGDLTYLKFPDYFYGIGNDTKQADKELTITRKFGAVANWEKEILPNVYAGPVSSIQFDKFENPSDNGLLNQNNYQGENGGLIWYLGGSIIFDSRDLSTYPTKGLFSKATISIANKTIFSDYDLVRLKMEQRAFIPIKKDLILGGHIAYEGLFGDAPFYQMRELGSSSIMRGYFPGRFRDQNLLAAQSEIRWRPFYLLGFSAFAGAGNVYSHEDFDPTNLKPNFGVGLRIFAEPSSKTTIRIDYGWGEKPPGEPRISGLTIFINEAF